MTYQMRARALTEEQKAASDQLMSSDADAGREVEEFAKNNPPEMKKRAWSISPSSSGIIGQRVGQYLQAGRRPFTEKAFLKHCELVLGLTDEEDEEEFKVHVNNKSLKRDNLGHKGAERIWIHAHDLDLDERGRYVDNQILEGSDWIRAPMDADRKMMKAGFCCARGHV